MAAIQRSRPVTLEGLEAEHALLATALHLLPLETDGADAAAWRGANSASTGRARAERI
jgi:hypothetical protein